ncbi:A-type flagellin [Moorella thermoacetica]|uniref:Flagellin n=1 Tax=Neomoorella thermoacetica TaxID=1525 RepID=A0A1J5JJZ1_NEOTH|nr:flagellin [Moorella thermoacetica]OIQ09838.1 A-type flagellin [Moorella thermoacetica]
MRINQNITALNAYRNLTVTNNSLTKSMEKLSSGLRINRAADDAAGLAISEKMRGQIRGLNQAVRNAQDAISLIQTAEGALNETHSILQRMRELAVQSASDTNTNDDRAQIQKEIDQLAEELSRISNTTEFNTKNLLAGGLTDQKFQIGANSDQNIALSVNAMDAKSLGVAADVRGVSGVGTTSTAGIYIKITDTTITSVKLVISSTAGIAVAGGVMTITVASTSKTLNDVLAQINKYTGTGVIAGLEPGAVGTATATAESVAVSLNGVKSTAAVTGANGTVTKAAFVAAGINVSTQAAANAAITTIDEAIKKVSSERSKLGAIQNRLDHTISNLSVASENLTAAESRIRDVDMAQEMMNYTKNQILSQAGTAMLAQANQLPSTVLQLLR